jgi:predicted nucleic acid-binding protein
MDVVAIYRDALENSLIRLEPISRAVLVRAAMLRGQLGMKMPDAIHAATAVDSACSAFLTNDTELRVPKRHRARALLRRLIFQASPFTTPTNGSSLKAWATSIP